MSRPRPLGSFVDKYGDRVELTEPDAGGLTLLQYRHGPGEGFPYGPGVHLDEAAVTDLRDTLTQWLERASAARRLAQGDLFAGSA